MADNKKSIVVYTDWMHTFEGLEDDEAGRLIKHIFRYVNDLNPDPPDKLTKIAFEPIKQQLKRDLVKYEGKRKQWSDAGHASAMARKAEKENKNSTVSTDLKKRSTKSTVNVIDNVNVIDTDTVITKEAVRSNVFLHRKEIEKLKTQYSDEDIEWMYDKLSSYKLSKGKTYKSDYGAILTWVVDSLNDFRLKEKNSAKKENGTKHSKVDGYKQAADTIFSKRGINPNDHLQQKTSAD